MVAVAHIELADDAAGRMLHFLYIRIDNDRPGRDQRAGNLRGRSPAADAENKARDQHSAAENWRGSIRGRYAAAPGSRHATPAPYG